MNLPSSAPSTAINVTARQVAEKLGIGLSTVYALWDAGLIRSVRIGTKLRRTSWAWVQEYIDSHPGTVG